MLPDNGTAYVTRMELNGSLRRIETAVQNTHEEVTQSRKETRGELAELRKEVSKLNECVHARVPWEDFKEHVKEDDTEHKKLRGRPSWGVTTAITLLAGGLSTTITLILAGVIK